MQINGSFKVAAAPDTVWQFLFDVERMAQCMPGVESIEALDDKTYRGVLKVKLGPISAAFSGTATLSEVDAPQRLVALIEGSDKTIASAVRATFTAVLSPAEGGTRMTYEMEVNIRGRLAQFGSAVIGATAKKMTAEFAKNMRLELES